MVERLLELRKRTPETPQERATARREIEPSADRARAGFFHTKFGLLANAGESIIIIEYV